MTSIGTGYDLSASTYSPDGRIFQVSCGCAQFRIIRPTYARGSQVEYAGKAVEHSGYAA